MRYPQSDTLRADGTLCRKKTGGRMSILEPQALRSFGLFERLDDQEIDTIAAHASSRRVAAGQAVFAQGAPADEFFVLASGKLKVTQLTADGQQVVIRFITPGELFGIARALKRPDYPGTATAVVDSVAVVWPMAFWDTFLAGDPSLAIGAMQTVGQRLQESHTRLREMATQDVEQRVAHAVLRLAKQAGTQEEDGIRIDFPLSKQDIAEMTGTTLHTVSRILSAWQIRGLVRTGRKKLLIRDSEGLAKLASIPRR